MDSNISDKINRADKIIKYGIISMNAIVVLFLIIMLYQNQANSNESRLIATQNQVRTQEYIKCVAEALTKPLAQHQEGALDGCIIQADNKALEIK